jgi:hypothetical protein
MAAITYGVNLEQVRSKIFELQKKQHVAYRDLHTKSILLVSQESFQTLDKLCSSNIVSQKTEIEDPE